MRGVTALLALLLSVDVATTAFDDAELERLLRAEARVAVCIWSPHMPLSVEAVTHIQAAGRSIGVHVVAVLDPRADTGYAVLTASDAKLPRSVLRRALATMLQSANAFQHAPTVVTFANGRQTGTPIVGFMDAAGYEYRLRQRFVQEH